MTYAGQDIASDFAGKILKKDLKKRTSTVKETAAIKEATFRDKRNSDGHKNKRKKSRLDIIV